MTLDDLDTDRAGAIILPVMNFSKAETNRFAKEMFVFGLIVGLGIGVLVGWLL